MWQTIVRDYQTVLGSEKGLHSVKNVCELLLKEAAFNSSEKVIDFLNDYHSISLKHETFHRKWRTVSHLKDIADYDLLEAEKIRLLLEKLKAYQVLI